jgi:hypothetical protein
MVGGGKNWAVVGVNNEGAEHWWGWSEGIRSSNE